MVGYREDGGWTDAGLTSWGAQLPQAHHCGEEFYFLCTKGTRARNPQALQSPGPSDLPCRKQQHWREFWGSRPFEPPLNIFFCQNSKCQLLPQIDSCHLPGLSRSFNNSGGRSPGVRTRLAAPSISGIVATPGERREKTAPAYWRASACQAERPCWVWSCWALLNSGQENRGHFQWGPGVTRASQSSLDWAVYCADDIENYGIPNPFKDLAGHLGVPGNGRAVGGGQIY